MALIKDHERAQLVNELLSTAVNNRRSQQLRTKLAMVVKKYLGKTERDEQIDKQDNQNV